ncbi:MAG: nucleoside-diphosphate-sugar epimerase [Chloroflexi bacterium RBG_13_56_8]|nr:MAG: nucleoside-diphosphate-sugar epimerase [Chloroflexi bacterium RBG_13_56_8]
MKNVLVTGGAGFIGSHLVEALVARGHRVRVLDLLVPQVHGEGAREPRYLPDGVEFLRGDVAETGTWERALEGMEVVFHEAAEVGVAQSMYEIVRYVRANTMGTSLLLELLATGKYGVEKLLVASSMSIYGEGAYECASCGRVYPQLRSPEQLARREWEMRCPNCGELATPVPTDEDKPLYPTSIYAITKRDQEEMCLVVGRAYGIPTVALRYFNVYGPRQALSNPYTGVAAIFSSRLLNGNPPLIFEDGLQSRAFVHVSDIVQANLLAMESDAADYQVFNVGAERPTTILEVARALAKALGVEIEPQVVGKFREGDIRHCYADISKAQRLLGYEPKVAFEKGIADLVVWVREQESVDLVDRATSELTDRGLTR